MNKLDEEKKNVYHVVIRPDAKHLSEVAKGDRRVCFEPKISIMVSWSQVTALTAKKDESHYIPSKGSKARVL